MTPDALEVLVALARDGLWLALLVAAPAVLGSLAGGVLAGALGVVTQLRDPALSIAPRIAGAALGLALASPAIAEHATTFAAATLAAIPALGR